MALESSTFDAAGRDISEAGRTFDLVDIKVDGRPAPWNNDQLYWWLAANPLGPHKPRIQLVLVIATKAGYRCYEIPLGKLMLIVHPA
ncbi:hypothetical protein FQN49_006032 [Arthroderma sp. PD_2]|nr:hypothetical protein FQN49_006032 [Arthroderma sp. PD_2]